ncbi:MAG TPA: hypothetical protein VNA27_00090 [Rubrobacteraceae bacterium]|nr:hypothetical protein [Rubrobacteraceae bacterium]
MLVYRVQSGDTQLCMNSGVTFARLRGIWGMVSAGAAAFDEIVQRRTGS